MASKQKKTFKNPFAAPVKTTENVCHEAPDNVSEVNTEKAKKKVKKTNEDSPCNETTTQVSKVQETKQETIVKPKKNKKVVSTFSAPEPNQKKSKKQDVKKDTKLKKRKLEANQQNENSNKNENEKPMEISEMKSEEIRDLKNGETDIHENDMVDTESNDIKVQKSKDEHEESEIKESDLIDTETQGVKVQKQKVERELPPVRSLTDEEYEEIFQNAISRATNTPLDELLEVLYKKPKLPAKKMKTMNVDKTTNVSNDRDGHTETKRSKQTAKPVSKPKKCDTVHEKLECVVKDDRCEVEEDKCRVEEDEYGVAEDKLGETTCTDKSDVIECGAASKAHSQVEPDKGHVNEGAINANVGDDVIQFENETTPEGSEVGESSLNESQETPPPKKRKGIHHLKEQNLEPRKLTFKAKSSDSKTQRQLSHSKKEGNNNDRVDFGTKQKGLQKKKTSDVDISSKKQQKVQSKVHKVSADGDSSKKKQKQNNLEKKCEDDTSLQQEKIQIKMAENNVAVADLEKKRQKQNTKLEKKDIDVQEDEKPQAKKRKQSRKKTMLEREVQENGTWVQCCSKTCSKWRYLPTVTDPTEIPETWVCNMNSDENYNMCEKPEQVYDESEHIFTNYAEGSLVWAKMSGYPWWPAMVEIDPDDECYFKLMNPYSMHPSHYHVVFFDDKVSRAWTRSNYIQPFIGKENLDVLLSSKSSKGPSFKKEITAAKEKAFEAIDMSVKERIKKYSFGVRFTGKWGKNDDSESTSDVKEKPNCGKKRIKCSRNKEKKQKSCNVEILDDTTVDELISGLDGLDDVLESLESEILTEGSNFDCWTEDEDFSMNNESKTPNKGHKSNKGVSKEDRQSNNELKTTSSGVDETNVTSESEDNCSNIDEDHISKSDEFKFDSQIYTMELDSVMNHVDEVKSEIDSMCKQPEMSKFTENGQSFSTKIKSEENDEYMMNGSTQEQTLEGSSEVKCTKKVKKRANEAETDKTFISSENQNDDSDNTGLIVGNTIESTLKCLNNKHKKEGKSVKPSNKQNENGVGKDRKVPKKAKMVQKTKTEKESALKNKKDREVPSQASSIDKTKSVLQDHNSECPTGAEEGSQSEPKSNAVECKHEETEIDLYPHQKDQREQTVPSPDLEDNQSQDFDSHLSIDLDIESLAQKHNQDSIEIDILDRHSLTTAYTEDSDPFDMEE